MRRVYYNEIDQQAAAWLRELIRQRHLPDGEVDTRSIVAVRPDELRGFRQCHFFAGIGGWAYALQLADWPIERELWTGSCPCQPFSLAGARVGGEDPRHLWPAWFQLIRERRPECLAGEQVEGALAHGWLDLVFDDLEREGYAAGAACLPAASVGAWHLRPRVWFVADTRHGSGPGGDARRDGARPRTREEDARPTGRRREDGAQLGDTDAARPQGRLHAEHADQRATEPTSVASMADADAHRRGDAHLHLRPAGSSVATPVERGPDFWRAVDWIPCADGYARPVEPGTFPLAHGIPARVGRLRGYGNAIVPQVAAAVLRAYLSCER